MRDHLGFRLWALWFIFVIGGVLAAQVTGFSYNDVTPGVSESFPEPELGRVFDATYYAEVDRYLAGDLAIQGLGLRARVLVDYQLFGDSTTPFVVAGDDGWLYYAPYLAVDCQALQGLRDRLPLARTDGAEVWIMVSEPKASYHPEPLPAEWAEPGCAEDARASIRTAPGSVGVLHDRLQSLVSDGRDAFLRDDTHWSTAARLEVAETIVETIAPGVWDPGAVREVDVARTAGLRRVLGWSVGGTMPGHQVAFPVDVEVADYRTLQGGGDLLMRQTSSGMAPQRVEGTTYLLGDSQLAYVIPLIAPYFEHLRFENWPLSERRGEPFADATEPGRIFIQSIEPSASQRLADPDVAEMIARLGVGSASAPEAGLPAGDG